MVRRLRGVIEPFARAKPRVETQPTEVRTFGDWQAEQSEFVSLSLYCFPADEGRDPAPDRARIRQPPGRRLLRRHRRRAAPRRANSPPPRKACSPGSREAVSARSPRSGRGRPVRPQLARARPMSASPASPGPTRPSRSPASTSRPGPGRPRRSRSSIRSPACARSSRRSPPSAHDEGGPRRANGATGSARRSARSASRRAPCSPVPNSRCPN